MYKVFLNNQNIVEIHYEGDITIEEEESAVQKATEFLGQLASENKKRLILVDISKMNPPKGDVRKAALEIAKTIPSDKIAFYSPSTFVRIVTKFISIASGRYQKTDDVFKTREDALKWLLT